MSDLLTIVLAVIGSSGLWTLITALINNRQSKHNATSRMVLGLGHDRLLALCDKYLYRGYITRAEYENLIDYLYIPYIELGGNSLVKAKVEQVKDELPIKEHYEEGEIK